MIRKHQQGKLEQWHFTENYQRQRRYNYRRYSDLKNNIAFQISWLWCDLWEMTKTKISWLKKNSVYLWHNSKNTELKKRQDTQLSFYSVLSMTVRHGHLQAKTCSVSMLRPIKITCIEWWPWRCVFLTGGIWCWNDAFCFRTIVQTFWVCSEFTCFSFQIDLGVQNVTTVFSYGCGQT